jgi:hypothetical protein
VRSWTGAQQPDAEQGNACGRGRRLVTVKGPVSAETRNDLGKRKRERLGYGRRFRGFFSHVGEQMRGTPELKAHAVFDAVESWKGRFVSADPTKATEVQLSKSHDFSPETLRLHSHYVSRVRA